MNQKKMGGVVAMLTGFAAMIFAIYLFMLGSGNNHNLLNVILYLCCGAVFFFWGINVLIPNKQTERNPGTNEFRTPLN
jgi:zinc transporter ZupT